MNKELRGVRVWRDSVKEGWSCCPIALWALWALPISAFKAPLLPETGHARTCRETYFLDASCGGKSFQVFRITSQTRIPGKQGSSHYVLS